MTIGLEGRDTNVLPTPVVVTSEVDANGQIEASKDGEFVFDDAVRSVVIQNLHGSAKIYLKLNSTTCAYPGNNFALRLSPGENYVHLPGRHRIKRVAIFTDTQVTQGTDFVIIGYE